MIDAIRRLFDHMMWADERAFASLAAAQHPTADAGEIFAHILGAEHVWLARLEGRVAEVAVWPDPSLEACAALAARNRGDVARALASLTEDALARSVHYTNSAGVAFDSQVADILVHIAMHGAYHRGQVALMVRRAGDQPSATDYIAFVRGAPAATRVPQG